MAGGNAVKSILYALIANSSIAVAKGLAAAYTMSGAMLAEAVHSVADAINQLLLLLGLRIAKRSPSEEHPLGYGKSVYFWSFIVALMLFSVGGMFSLYEGWHKLHDPHPINAPWVAIAVLVFAITAEGWSFRACLQEVNKTRQGRSWWRWFRDTRQSALLVIFGEDLAALLGLIFALLAILVTLITGNPVYDAIGTMAIGILLIVMAVLLSIEVKALLVGQGVDPLVKQDMLRFLDEQPEIEKVFNVVTLHMGKDVMVAVKAKMVPMASDTALIDAINLVEKSFKAAFPDTVWLFFEPDNKD